MDFTKIQGAGNDFIIIENFDLMYDKDTLKKIAKVLCQRKKSIGADGLMVVQKSENGCDFKLSIYNSDGSEAEMCGNGARCIARYAYEHNFAKETMKIETMAGVVEAKRINKRLYKIKLNNPSVINLKCKLNIDNRDFDCAYVELGNPGIPHAVVRLDELDSIDEDSLIKLGRKIRYCDIFRKGANVNFCKVLSDDTVLLKTYERGVEDLTLACGTGSGSTSIALMLKNRIKSHSVKLLVPGGELKVDVELENGVVNAVYLTGDTNIIAVGTVLDEDL